MENTFCPKCGSKQEGNAFCSKCGNKLKEDSTTSKEKNVIQSKPAKEEKTNIQQDEFNSLMGNEKKVKHKKSFMTSSPGCFGGLIGIILIAFMVFLNDTPFADISVPIFFIVILVALPIWFYKVYKSENKTKP